LARKFWGVQGDIASVGEFIRLYLTRYQRWGAPLFLAGESYGTTRASGLSGYLIDRGIAFNGIVLISSVLNFQTLEFAKGNDLPYVLFLPTYTATAWFHKKLPQDLSGDLQRALHEVEQWSPVYENALAKGDELTPQERQDVVAHLSRYTGLSPEFVDEQNLRIDEPHFTRELLRREKRQVGRLDSRFVGAPLSGGDRFPYDPSEAAIRPPYTTLFNNYVRAELGYKSDLEYFILGGGITEPWEWGSAAEGFPNVTDALRRAFVKNPYMHLFVAEGYYDLATPYFASEYTLHHLDLDPATRGNVSTGRYEAGHMVYIRDESLRALKNDVSTFMQKALQPNQANEVAR
jgi:carboxypeptidase C (cathepsin A)